MVGYSEYSLLVLYEVFISLIFRAFVYPENGIKKYTKKICITFGGKFNKKRNQTLTRFDSIKFSYLIFAFLPILLVFMFHSYKIGNDSKVYYEFYRSISRLKLSTAIQNSRFEIGYVFFVWFISHIFNNPQFLFIITGIIFCISLFAFLYRYSESPGMFMILFVELLIFDGWISISRQTLSLCIILFAYSALIEKKILKYYILIFIASLFHNSALVFLLIYPIFLLYEYVIHNSKRKFLFYLLLIISVAVIIVLFNFILQYLLSKFTVYEYYVNSDYMNGTARVSAIINLIIYIGFIVIPEIFPQRKRSRINYESEYYALHIISMLNVIILVLTNFSTIFNRFSFLLTCFAVLEFSNKLITLKNRKFLQILLICVFWIYGLAVTILKTGDWQTTYPLIWFWQTI